MERATFTSADPTLRHTLTLCGISFAPAAISGEDWWSLYADVPGDLLGILLGVYTPQSASMVIRSTRPGVTIRDAFIAKAEGRTP